MTLYKRRKLKVNPNKSKVMVFDRNSVTCCRISMSKQEMERVEDFKYLGCKLSRDSILESEVEETVKKVGKLPRL